MLIKPEAQITHLTYGGIIFFSCWLVLGILHLLISIKTKKKTSARHIVYQFLLQLVAFTSIALPIYLFVVVMTIAVLVLVDEFSNLLCAKSVKFYKLELYLPLAFYPLVYAYFFKHLLAYLLVSTTVVSFNHMRGKSIKQTYQFISIFLLLIFVVNMFSFFILLNEGPLGFAWCFLAISLAKLSDISSFSIAKFYPGHSLINNKISPHKSYQVDLIAHVINIIYAVSIKNLFFPHISYLQIILVSFIVTLFAQFGDLFFSMVKRYFSQKDFSSLIPGIGGLADWLDSLVFIAPALYSLSFYL